VTTLIDVVGLAGLCQVLLWKRVQIRWMQAASHHAQFANH